MQFSEAPILKQRLPENSVWSSKYGHTSIGIASTGRSLAHIHTPHPLHQLTLSVVQMGAWAGRVEQAGGCLPARTSSFCSPQLIANCTALLQATACTCRPQPRNSPSMAQYADPAKGDRPPLQSLRYLVRYRYGQASGHVLLIWLHGGCQQGFTPQHQCSTALHCTGQPRPGHECYEPGMTRGVYVDDNILQWRSHTPQPNSYSTHTTKYPPLLLSSQGNT